jgi:hypothetical protein
MFRRRGALLISFAAAVTLAASSLEARAAMADTEVVEANWAAAIDAYKARYGDILNRLQAVEGYSNAANSIISTPLLTQSFADDLIAINALSSLLEPKVHLSGSPVLAPIDISRLAAKVIGEGTFSADTKAGSYFGLLRSFAFFPGAHGYRAYFRLKKTSSVMIAGSSIFYKFPAQEALPQLDRCLSIIDSAQRDAQFYQYITNYENRLGLVEAQYFDDREAVVPCLFFGALVEIHILCDFVGDPDCKVRDIIRSVIRSLAFVGGSPRLNSQSDMNDPISRISKVVSNLSAGIVQFGKSRLPRYADPGDLIKNSGENGSSAGSRDSGIYGALLFPTDAEAAVQTLFHQSKTTRGEWRDNFCEARGGNWLFACPHGHGHAGEDIWDMDWKKILPKVPLRAVVDGVAFRRFPAQPAVTISDVNATNIDYIYRHMRPSDLSRHGILPSEAVPVARGCVLAYVDRLESITSKRTGLTDNGINYQPTAPHLHFEIRVPTRAGFQNVDPYATLVQSHQALITGVDDPLTAGLTCPDALAPAVSAMRALASPRPLARSP